MGAPVTCDHCPRPAHARDGDRLLCVDHWRERHVVPEPADRLRPVAHLTARTVKEAS